MVWVKKRNMAHTTEKEGGIGRGNEQEGKREWFNKFNWRWNSYPWSWGGAMKMSLEGKRVIQQV
jgi:hypothetical protein